MSKNVPWMLSPRWKWFGQSQATGNESFNWNLFFPNTEPFGCLSPPANILFGEGFDPPRLDTVMLALPVSWKGLIAGNTPDGFTATIPARIRAEVRVYDYIDLRVPICDSMYKETPSRIQSCQDIPLSPNEGILQNQQLKPSLTPEKLWAAIPCRLILRKA